MEVLYPRCAGLDVHSRRVNACVRVAAGRTVTTEHREFATTTAGLLELAAWLTEAGCTGRIPDFPVTRSHPPASWPSAANSSICRTYRKTAGEESRRRSPVANRWMRP